MLTPIDQYKYHLQLSVHSNFSFMNCQKEIWENADISNSLFNGGIFENCYFRGIMFDASDLEGARFIQCEFKNCTFKSTDIRSIIASGCNFTETSFDGANISDGTFKKCNFCKCSFNDLVLAETEFDVCFFEEFRPQNSSIILNKYSKCVFSNSRFCNVFYYQIFYKCEFYQSTYEAYLLGFTYGLTQHNYSTLECYFMGEQMLCSLFEMRESVLKIYMDRKMYLNAGFLILDNEGKSLDNLLLQCTRLLSRYLHENQIVKKEQIRFFESLVNLFRAKNAIAPATFFLIDNELALLISSFKDKSNSSWIKAEPYIRELKNTVYFLFIEYLEQINFTSLPSSNKNVIMMVVYNEKPRLPLTKIMMALDPSQSPPFQIKSAKGSFLEWISCQENITTLVDLFIKLVSGVAVPFITTAMAEKIRNKKNSETRKDENKNSEIKNIQASPKAVVRNEEKSEIILVTDPETGLPLLFSKTPSTETVTAVANTIRVILDLNVLDYNDRQGYNANNISRIEVFNQSQQSK